MINMPRALMGKVSVQEQMGDARGEVRILGKKQKAMLEINNTVTEMKNTSDGIISRLWLHQSMTQGSMTSTLNYLVQ